MKGEAGIERMAVPAEGFMVGGWFYHLESIKREKMAGYIRPYTFMSPDREEEDDTRENEFSCKHRKGQDFKEGAYE